MRKKKLIVYGRNIEDFENISLPLSIDIVRANPKYFKYPDSSVDYFYSTEDKVIKAYERAEVPFYNIREEIVEVEPEPIVEQVQEAPEVVAVEPTPELQEDREEEPTFLSSEPLPEDWREIPFPKRRSLAKKYTDKVLRNATDVDGVLELVAKVQGG